MEGGNNNSGDMNYESQPNDQTNFVPITDPFAIPSGSSNIRPHIDQNRAIDSSHRLGGDTNASNSSQPVISSGIAGYVVEDNGEGSEANGRRFSSIRRAPEGSSSIGESSPIEDHNNNDDDSDDDDSDVHHFGQVVLGLVAPSQQEWAERARQIANDNDLVRRYTADQAVQANALWHHRVASSLQPQQRIIFPHESAEGAFHPVAPPPSQLPIPHPFIPQFSEADSNISVHMNTVPASATYIWNGPDLTQLERWQVIMETDRTVVYGMTIGDGDDREPMRLNVEGMTYEELVALGERIGLTSTGLTDDAIRENLRHDKYGSSSFASTSRNDSCCICQEDYVNGEEVSTLECGHTYHFGCIKQWLAIKNKCPICKRPALSP